MLKQPIYYEFNLDARTSPSKLIAISHVDDKYSEVLEVAVKQNDRFVYMGGATVVARMVLHREKDYLLSDSVPCTVNANGNILIPFDNAVVKTLQGVVKIEVNITRDTDELTLQFPLWVSVNGSILDNAEVTPESEGTIPDLLKDAADALEDATEALDRLGSYSNLEDKPQINGVTLSGNKTSGELRVAGWKTAEIDNCIEDGVLYSTSINNQAAYVLARNITTSITQYAFCRDGRVMWRTRQAETSWQPVGEWSEWEEIGFKIASGVINQNGTISFYDADGNLLFTTTGASVIGPQGAPGNDYVLTAQDKADIARMVDISGKADKATTLAGYGINDAYTKAEVTALNSAKVDKADYTEVVQEIAEEVGDLKSAIDDIDDDFYDYVPASLANPTRSGLATANIMWAVRFPSDFVSSPLVTICPKFNANSGTYTATRWYCADDTFPNLSVVTEVESITANINEAVSFENVTKNEFFTFLSSNTADRAYYCNSASKIHNCPSGRVVQSGSSYVYYTGDANVMTTSQFDIQVKQSVTVKEQQQIDDLKIALTPTFIEYERARGSLLVNGTLNTTLNIYYKKYTIPSGETKISLDGTTVHAGAVTGLTPCVLWFVSNGTMMSNQYVSVSMPFQTWDMHEVSIPSGAEEIWAEEAMTIYSGSGYEKDIPRRVALLENSEQTNFTFSGSFTWSKRIFGLRVLADAQGCYFIPFSSLGLGISRMNGRYGDDYIADQIHSTALGAYNTASGIWSYLKNIPCWHTSVPSTTQVFDGSQWNGKKWYAYGTSLTLGAGGGNYVTRVANFSGLIATNKGIGGGALVTNRNIYNALLDMTDGKLEADLITIEVGANDVGPLGEPWSTNTNEFYGALNHCIKSMFASGVQAQIVIMASYPVRYNPSDPTDIYDVDELYNV